MALKKSGSSLAFPSFLCKGLSLEGDMKAVPADLNLIAQVQWVIGCCAILEVADIEGGERVVDEAMHGPVLTVHVEVH